jgi:hypothetical protein
VSCRARSSVAKRDRNTAMSLSATEKSRDCLNSNLRATSSMMTPHSVLPDCRGMRICWEIQVVACSL